MRTMLTSHFLYQCIAIILVAMPGNALAGAIDIQQTTTIQSSTRAEAQAGGSQSAVSRVTTETKNGETTVHVHTAVNGAVRTYVLSTTTPVSVQAQVTAGAGSGAQPDAATVHVNQEPLHSTASATPAASASIAASQESPSPAPAALGPGNEFAWWHRVRTQLATVVFPYLISLWHHS